MPCVPAIRVQCPAKLNLDLRVLGRRDDGFHELVSTFCGVSLFDTLTLWPRADGELHLRVIGGGRDIPQDGSNLVLRAATALRRHIGTDAGADIELVKRIPSQAGLGGGSSDAAGTLLGLARLWAGHLPTATLHEIAAALGSDVNFFVERTVAAVCRGRGEVVDPVAFDSGQAFVLALPPFGAPTGEVFAAFRQTSIHNPGRGGYPEFAQTARYDRSAPWSHNDLQDAALATVPGLADWYERLGETGRSLGMTNWMMSGSGTAFFHKALTPRTARRAANFLSSFWAVDPGRKNRRPEGRVRHASRAIAVNASVISLRDFLPRESVMAAPARQFNVTDKA